MRTHAGNGRTGARRTAIAIALSATTLLAQPPPRGVALSPTSADLKGPRGSTEFSVFNLTPRPVHVSVEAADFTLPDDTIRLTHSDCPFSARPFLTEIYPGSFLLPPGRSRQIRISYAIPDPRPAGYHAALVITFRTPARADTSTPQAAFAPKLLFLLTITVGHPTHDAQISRFTVKEGRAMITVRNSGSTHFRLNGGSHIAGRQLPPFLVLPGSERTFTVPISEEEADRPLDASLDTGALILKARRIP